MFLIIFFILSAAIFSQEKVVMKNGSFINGEIKKVTKKGIKIESKELGVLIDVSWSNISKKSAKMIRRKYKIKEIEEPVKVDEVENEKNPETIVKPANVNVAYIARDLFEKYIALVKYSIKSYALGFDVELIDGLSLNLKNGSEINGYLISEDDDYFNLSVKGRQKKIAKDTVHEFRKLRMIKRGGSIGLTQDNKKVGSDLHIKILKAVADDLGIKVASAEEIYAKRLSGGIINDGKYQGKYNSYKYKSSVNLGTSSFLFSGKKGKEIMEELNLEWWGKLSLKEKENIYMGVYIVNKLPKFKMTPRRCPKCKGKGHLNRPVLNKGSKTKETRDRNRDRKKSEEKDENICPDCKGLKVLYKLQYE